METNIFWSFKEEQLIVPILYSYKCQFYSNHFKVREITKKELRLITSSRWMEKEKGNDEISLRTSSVGRI